MRFARLLVVVLWFAAVGHGQTSCQQACSNRYNVCTGNADQQQNQCLLEATSPPCFCDSQFGCSPPPDYCPTEQECNYLHDQAISSCDANYADCSNSCDPALPPRRASIYGPGEPPDEAAWALLMRKLSRPGKFKLTV